MKTRTLSPMKNLFIGIGLIASHLAICQVVVFTGSRPEDVTKVAARSGTNMAITDDLTVQSDDADFSKIILTLAGVSQELRMSRGNSVLTLGGLIVGQKNGGNGGTKDFYDGSWEVDGNLVFNDGIVVPQSPNGKLVHTQANGTTASILVNNPDSYVNGIFYSRGTGNRFFPIGNSLSGSYYPAMLSSATQGDVEVGMRVVNSNSGLTTGSDLLPIFAEQYWELLDPSQSFAGSFISLSTLGAGSYISPSIATVVVGGSSIGSPAVNLDGAQSGDFIVGGKKITVNERIFTLAQVLNDQVVVKIRNVVTPFRDGANDFLEIENIHLFEDNKVTMLDRWGVPVKEWAGFKNVTDTVDPDYDLTKVATGNYIVILEYKDGTARKQLSQMVTLINQ